ncbi:DUF4129 domain-containing protein [Halorientalis pallida]|uniref:DUF4129 domain-containing protein n=1 Tax=Halorientalis pallida TaxID=2479928 RepID=A0A498L6N7_9EURY|nr:DUF4129 domain-containing protein [Halorientalis pallida]RXK51952.1 DUF4129 domain-containing protein [Halorientalis pallida]
MAEGGSPARQRQLALLAVCALGLLVAAFAAPQVDAGLGLGSGGPDGPGERPDAPTGGGGDGSGDGGVGFGDAVEELLEWLSSDDEPRDGEPASVCTVRFAAEPAPGATVPVVVTDERGRVEGARVSLDGEVVGTTDERGTVPVEVPYERELTLDATLPAGSTCSTSRDTAGVEAAPASAAVAPVAAGVGAPESSRWTAAAQVRPGEDDGDDADGPRVTRGVTVDGEVRIAVEGEPIPGERVTLGATVDGEPMREATVSVDGQRVGTTDDEGRYRLRVPTDGPDSIRVRVERGEFGGEKRIDVTNLRAVVRPATILAIPGGDAVVVARLGNRTVPNATVTLGGERLGTTDAQGRLRFSLPSDPTAVIALRAGDLTARQSLVPLYAVTALVALLVVLALALVVAKLRGRTGNVRGTAISLTERLRRLARWLVGLAFRVTAALEGLLDWLAVRLRALRAVLASLTALGSLGAVRDAVAGALAWLLALPGRAWAALLTMVAWLRGLPGRLRRRGADDGTATADDSVTATGADERDDPAGLRERWRAFARWVAPERWPQRTPGEVAREAAETGFPHESVRDLTRVFRDVEYGGRPETPEREERARTAFDALRDHREADAVDDRPDEESEVTDRG